MQSLFGLLTILCACASSAEAHPFHVSIAEANRNPKTGNLEIALKVFPGDLERAVRLKTKQPVDLDKTKNVDKLIVEYLNTVFRVKSVDGKRRKIKWVGKEVTLKDAWLYFEIPIPGGLEGAELEYRLFFELQEDQVNTINLVDGKRGNTLTFHKDRPKQVVKLAERKSEAAKREAPKP